MDSELKGLEGLIIEKAMNSLYALEVATENVDCDWSMIKFLKETLEIRLNHKLIDDRGTVWHSLHCKLSLKAEVNELAIGY